MPNKPATERRAPRQGRSKATVEAILTAAADVVDRHGYDRATTDRIAQRAGVSVGSLYQYYGNKNEIFVQLIQRERAKLIAGLQETRQGGFDDQAALLAQFIALGAGKNNLLFKIYRELLRSKDLSPLLDQLVGEVTQEVAALISSFRADLPAARATQMARLIVACAEGIGREPVQQVQSQLADEFQNMVIRYVAGEVGSPLTG